jgi:hypothetical protein
VFPHEGLIRLDLNFFSPFSPCVQIVQIDARDLIPSFT